MPSTAATVFAVASFLAASSTKTFVSAQYSGGDTSGCGKSHIFNGIPKYHWIDSGERTDRSYSVHLPDDYDENKQYPTIVGFHGSDSVGLFLEVDTKLDEARFTGDKIMIYPNGIDGAWGGPSYATTSVEEDIQFTHDLLADAKTEYCIDSARLYALGMSNGGGFIGSLACDPDVGGEFAAFASSSGSFYTDLNGPDNGCNPARDLTPLIEFHGGSDDSVHYEGGEGEGGTEPPIADWLSWWATRNACDTPNAQEDTHDGDMHHLVWTCGGVEGSLQHYKIDSMKHSWPSTEPNFSQLASGDSTTYIDASSIIPAFFDNFTRPAE